MLIADILTDIASRLPKETFSKYGEPGILRAMNRIYRITNRKEQCLEKTATFQESGDYGSTNPFNLPGKDIWGKEFDMRDANDYPITFVDPVNYDEDQDATWTIIGDKIYFGAYADTEVFTMRYFSQGYTLVIKDDGDLASDEVNEPEWNNSHDYLYYAVIAELDKLNEHESKMFRDALQNLRRNQYDRQSSTPATSYPYKRKESYIDDFEKNYYQGKRF